MLFHNKWTLCVVPDKDGWQWQVISPCRNVIFTSDPVETEAAAMQAAREYLQKFGAADNY